MTMPFVCDGVLRRYRPPSMPHDVEGLLTVSFAGRVGAAAQGGGTNDMQRVQQVAEGKAKGFGF